MANEELVQRKYLATGELKGDKFGAFEELNIGATSVSELASAGVSFTAPATVDYPFQAYKAPKSPGAAKPDRVFLRRTDAGLLPVAVGEHKAKSKLTSDKAHLKAAEQVLFAAAAVGARIAITTDGAKCRYVDVEASLTGGAIVYFAEKRDLNPSVLENLIAGDASVAKNPRALSETVWQIIWHATKEDPKTCLLTFVEIFVLKFLSDNLPTSTFPEAYRFYSLLDGQDVFKKRHGKTEIAYYVSAIRPFIKQLFPDNVLSEDSDVADIFGLKTIVSKTSIINGFAFLKSSSETLDSFNRTFLQILEAFHKFGPLTSIDPEFKLRLYETFLKNTPRQQKLGQFFTPRNIMRQMIRMAQLEKLKDNSVVLDPAAGVGGFVLEPLLIEGALKGNIHFADGKPVRRVKIIGVDVDANTHILAKANMLIHLAEILRDPSTTLPALNTAMAETFVLMHSNETLGALENPPSGSVDVILTNPPYVTQGSKIYRDEVSETKGTRNGLDLRDYYDRWGLGVEALFMRYISGALKPGGRAYVIVPLGMLNRTEPRPKQKLLDECNLVASITLPRNAFFNTSQPTSILVIEKRHTEVDSRPPIFCGFVRTIGETLDVRRVPTPNENDLETVADRFIEWDAGRTAPQAESPLVKIVPADSFSPNDRWDTARFWTEDEMVALGVKASAVERTEFIDDAINQIQEIVSDLEAAKAELAALTSGETREVSLSDESLFKVRSGERVRNEDIENNRGNIPVFSCFKDADAIKGRISPDWLIENGIPVEEHPLVTVIANGAKAVGKVFVRREEKYAITDDVIGIEVISDAIDLDFLASELRRSIAAGNFIYEAKLFSGRVKQLAVAIPTLPNGSFDLERQQTIAVAVKRFDLIRAKLHDIGDWSATARIS
ncbi:N-6 DNA methylase [Sphingomonas sp. AR_OL41]|uniref:N-6 DNA methylase n=1 Tax=Sphingomonas sp. AR_OL41 TaxID=3042729 RepID=UPI00247FE3A7|nr:N-6 DNA methylase [Sphingomonas sp. AR_OL41]MDH7973527.1 N-6 DNA methylase [Sphingomonas sp. AR_OL41]